jgi:hypothetical protein
MSHRIKSQGLLKQLPIKLQELAWISGAGSPPGASAEKPASTTPGSVRRPTRRNVGLPAFVEFVRRDGWDCGYLLVYAHSGAYSV